MTARVTLLTRCRWQRRSSGTILLLACKVGVVDYVVKVSDAGINDSSVERWLFLCWKPCQRFGWRIRVEREASFFFRRRDIAEKKKNNPCRSSLSRKFFFFKLLSSNGGKIFFSITCIIFEVDDENKVNQSLIFFFLFHSWYQHFAGQNDQLRLKSSKAALKAFQMIFPWLKMK